MARQTLTERLLAQCDRPGHRDTNSYSSCRRGKRADLGGLFVRSAWEANYCRYLNLLQQKGQIKGWEYEPHTFTFHGETKGVVSYTPDFRVTENDGRQIYHELKGWMRSKDRTKHERMAKHYPDVTLILVGAAQYREIERKIAAFIPDWEYP